MADNKDKKVLNVPALRFPGFKNSWDCTILEKLSKKIGDGIHSTPSYDDDGTFYFISGNNLNRGKIVITSSTKRVSEKEAYKNNAENLEADSILMSINGTIGNVALYNNEPIMLGKSACYINSKDNVDKKFLFYYLQYPKTQSYFEAELTGTTIKNLSLQSIRKTKICIPTIEEQHKISHFLQKIDERIATQNKIIEDWKKLKSAIYQKIFESLVAPTLKLGQIVEIIKGQQVNGTDLLEQGDYYVMNGGTTPSGWLNTYNTECNTISISEGGNSCGYVQYNTSRYWSGGHCYSLRILNTHETIDLYLYHYLKWQEGNIMALRIGSGLPNIQKKDLLRFPVILPTISLQKRIVSILNAIEEKVTCENSITEHFTKHKEYLLNELFI
ncbi:MAG: restriction endonuclease subunit S [Candidatus Phocaeicola faecipullorum]|nr:restriction endonuclease subunit S [Candidatus Phocaeicola faecipullorum]